MVYAMLVVCSQMIHVISEVEYYCDRTDPPCDIYIAAEVLRYSN